MGERIHSQQSTMRAFEVCEAQPVSDIGTTQLGVAVDFVWKRNFQLAKGREIARPAEVAGTIEDALGALRREAHCREPRRFIATVAETSNDKLVLEVHECARCISKSPK